MVALFGLTVERIVVLIPDIQDPDVKDSIKADFTFALLLAWTTGVCFISSLLHHTKNYVFSFLFIPRGIRNTM